jgi:hypothetical protein
VNRSIYFPAFIFLLLFALSLLLSEQFSRFSAPRSMLESGVAIDRAVVAKATLIDPWEVTKRDLQSDLAPVAVPVLLVMVMPIFVVPIVVSAGAGPGMGASRLRPLGGAAHHGELMRSTTWFEPLAVPPLSLMTCSMVPTPPRETVRRSWNWTPEVLGTSKAWALTMLGLTSKKQ